MATRHKPTTFPNFLLSALLSVFLLSVTLAAADTSTDVDLTKCLEKCQSLGQGPMVRMCEQLCKMEYQHEGEEEQPQRQRWSEPGEVRDQEDPELTKCLEECRSQPHYDIGMEKKCEDRCRQEHQPGKGEQQQRQRWSEPVEVRDQEDPELTKCLEECRSQPHYDIGMEKKCEERCRQEQQPQRRGSRESQDREDPEQRLAECRLKCQQQYRERGPQKKCETKCEETYRHERSSNPHRKYEKQEEEDNPYVFGIERLRYEIRSDRGYMKVLDKFHEKSKLLLGIANYSISLLVANPHTFVTPVHFDADCVCYVVEGRGTVTTLRKGERKSHEIRKGDVFVTESGSVLYLVSSHRRESLVLAKFLRSTSLTGQITHFYAAGGENPESVYRSFSDEVLEAAFNVPRDRIRRVFSKQREGVFVEASEEQIQALSRHTKEGGRWPFGDSRGPFNLLQKDPTHSNRHGKLYEADSDDDRKLGLLNLRVSLANISEGAMMAPFYNSRSTKFSVVTEGSGYVEILCPHLARQGQHYSQPQRYGEREEEQEEMGRGGRRYGKEGEEEEEYLEGRRQGQRYRRVRAHVSPGTVFIVPPGHPVVEVASRDQNLQTICFEIRADRNERIFLAGRNNILRKMEREAKELAFDTSAREVDAVFNSQREEVFFPGPGAHRQWHSRGESEEWEGSDTKLSASVFGFVAGF